jgi:Xaa-Pro aminopeptidase
MSFAYSEGNPVEDQSRLHKLPFDTERLDRLMEEAGLDALLVTSKQSIQYLLGNYRFFFYDYMDPGTQLFRMAATSRIRYRPPSSFFADTGW